MTTNKPAHEIRLGKVKATIWANQTQKGIMHHVTVKRLYRDGDKWQTTESLSREDLPLVRKVLDMAHT